MDYKLSKGNNSNYEIILDFTTEEFDANKDAVLKHFQKDLDIPGFRKGHVPLSMVEQQVNQEHLKLGMYEEAINIGLKKIVDENKEVQFIGQIYDLNQEEKEGKYIVTFKLDVYPTTEEKDQKWQKIKLDKVEDKPTKKEIDDTINNLKRQYAEYKDCETINETSVFKVKFEYKDKSGKVIDQGSTIFGKEDLEEFPIIKTLFYNKKNNEKFEEKYDEKSLPELLHNKKTPKDTKSIEFEIVDVKEVILPEMTEENIKKFFGDPAIKTEKELQEKIKEIIGEQKRQQSLTQVIDKFIDEAKKSISINIPATLVNEEVKSRLENLKQRFGGEEGFKQYVAKMTDEQKNQMMDDIQGSAKISLEKFFIFRSMVESLGIEDIDWHKPFDAEEKIYAKLVEGKKAPAKKAAAKKTTKKDK